MSGRGRETGHLSCWMLHLGQLIRAAISAADILLSESRREALAATTTSISIMPLYISANWEAFIAQVINYKIHSFQDLQSLQSCIHYT